MEAEAVSIPQETLRREKKESLLFTHPDDVSCAEEFRHVETFQRFNLNERIQHIAMFSSFILCVLTGFPLKFPDVEILNSLFLLTGGPKGARIIHRIAAVVMMADFLYHTYLQSQLIKLLQIFEYSSN